VTVLKRDERGVPFGVGAEVEKGEEEREEKIRRREEWR
jgi:hypothetical protein